MVRDRSAFGYMEPDPNIKEFAQCGSCAMFLRKVGRCHWLRKNDKVNDDATCIMYVQGTPNDDSKAEPTGSFDPETVGFYDGQVRCENCNARDFRDPYRKHCDLYVQLNRMYPNMWKLETKVEPRGCCNAWSPGDRNPKQFGPYGPLPDADDQKHGGLLFRLIQGLGRRED